MVTEEFFDARPTPGEASLAAELKGVDRRMSWAMLGALPVICIGGALGPLGWAGIVAYFYWIYTVDKDTAPARKLYAVLQTTRREAMTLAELEGRKVIIARDERGEVL